MAIKLTEQQTSTLTGEAVQTANSIMDLIQGLINWVLKRPLYALGGLIIWGMVSNKKGGGFEIGDMIKFKV